MERSPKLTKDKDTNFALDHIFQNALGNVVILTAEPTKAQVKANTLVYYNNEIFIRLANGEMKKFTVTDVP